MTQSEKILLLEKAVRQWNASASSEWKLLEKEAVWNLQHNKLFDYEWLFASGHIEDGALLLAEVKSPSKIPSKTLWIHFFFTPTRNVSQNLEKLLTLALEKCKSLKKMRLSFAADEFHLFPGMPLVSIFAEAWKEKFVTHEVCDLLVDLNSEKAKKIAKGYAALQFINASEAENFLREQYPGRWSREYLYTQDKILNDGSRWYFLCEGKNILGFVRLTMRQARCRPLAAMKFVVADCSLGPIAVRKDLQGKGIGRNLLAAAIAQLKSEGAQMLCIDWTDAVSFYQPLGRVAVRKYLAAHVDF